MENAHARCRRVEKFVGFLIARQVVVPCDIMGDNNFEVFKATTPENIEAFM